MGRSHIAAFGVALVAACGAEPEVGFSAALPWSAALADACGDPSALQGLEAVLWIGGHADCPLTVDPITLDASGTCDDLRVGVDRPLVVTYSLPAAERAQVLAHVIGWVDLREESLPDDGSPVEVVIGGRGDLFVHTDAEVLALPATYPDDATPEDRARAWTREEYVRRGETLDGDGDACPNLEEACNGTLDAAGDTTCG